MGSLRFDIVTKDVMNTDFDCGVDSINEYVRDSYYPTIVQHAYAYSISHNDIVIGYFMVMFREVSLEDFPEDIAGFDPEIKEGNLSSLHIRYLAIDKKYQKRHIGTAVLRSIIKKTEDMAVTWPIRVITIDARIDLVEWYIREKFNMMANNRPGQDGVTSAMYYDCMKFSDELEQYIGANLEGF